MSKIAELGENFAKISDILEQYEQELADVETNLALKGKNLEHANRENPVWQNYYDQRKVELSTLAKYFETQVQRVRGRLYKNLSQTSQKDLGDREKEKWINAEKEYLAMNELYLEVNEMYEKYKAVVDAYTARGYALNNITKIRVGALENVEI